MPKCNNAQFETVRFFTFKDLCDGVAM